MPITQVWNAPVELGGSNVTVKERHVCQQQEKVEIVAMDMDTAKELNEMRYHEFDLLEDGAVTGVTRHSLFSNICLGRCQSVCLTNKFKPFTDQNVG